MDERDKQYIRMQNEKAENAKRWRVDLCCVVGVNLHDAVWVLDRPYSVAQFSAAQIGVDKPVTSEWIENHNILGRGYVVDDNTSYAVVAWREKESDSE